MSEKDDLKEKNIIERAEIDCKIVTFSKNEFSEKENNLNGFKNDICFEKVGGKAYNLILLTQHGICVPKGHVITTGLFQKFLTSKNDENEISLGEMITEILEGETSDDAKKTSEDIERVFDSHYSHMLPLLQSEIERTVDKEKFYAVRSSGTLEDLSEASFAGQMDTFLNIPGVPDQIMRHILKCWISLFSERVLLYRKSKINVSDKLIPSIAVIVQEMVTDVMCSGIMFTANPVTGRRDEVVINSSYGLGEALVTGLVSCDSFHLDKKLPKITKRVIGAKKMKIVSKEDGMTKEVDVGGQDRERASLRDGLVLELTEIGLKIEERIYGGQFQDIEWAISTSGKIYILQSRPITSLFPIPRSEIPFFFNHDNEGGEEAEDEGEENEPHVNDVFLCLNYMQVYSKPFRPFGISLFRNYMCFVGNQEFVKTKRFPTSIDRIYLSGGYVYVNITDILSLSPKVDKLFANLDIWIYHSLMELRRRNYYSISQENDSDDPKDRNNNKKKKKKKKKRIKKKDKFNFLWTYVRKIVTTVVGDVLWGDLQKEADELTKYFAEKHEEVKKIQNEFIKKLEEEEKEGQIHLSELYETLESTKSRICEIPQKAFLKIMKSMVSFKIIEYIIKMKENENINLSDINSGILINSKELELALNKLVVSCGDDMNLYECIKFVVEKKITNPKIVIDVVLRRYNNNKCNEDEDEDEGEEVSEDSEEDEEESTTDSSDEEEISQPDKFIIEFEKFMDNWGFRGLGEIDSSNERFIENCSYVTNYIFQNFSSSLSKGRPEKGEVEGGLADLEVIKGEEMMKKLLLEEVWEKGKWKLWNLGTLGLGRIVKYKFTQRLGDMYRTLFKFREDPKHLIMRQLMFVKVGLIGIFNKYVRDWLLEEEEDNNNNDHVYYLYEEEIRYLVDYFLSKTEEKDRRKELRKKVLRVIDQRRTDFLRTLRTTKAPRVITSLGENVEFTPRENLLKNVPPNVLIGSGVSVGEVEGIVCIIKDPCLENEKINNKEKTIIVAKIIDPAFSALFHQCEGLVSEVGGIMTHGSVVARELGIPAVVCVQDACDVLKDGMRIRVDGTGGTVEILEEEEGSSSSSTSEEEEEMEG